MIKSQGPPSHTACRLALFLLLAAAWTLLAMYPNPAVFVRNIQRYRQLPLDPRIEQRMGWELPDNAAEVEFFVDSLIVSTPDWTTYRVPWYVPTAREAATATHGDCETKTVLLASLLQGKGLPFEIRASFNHIWVDYSGRKPQPGESAQTAYLQGKGNRLHLHWPSRVAWKEFFQVQRQQLWTPMPLPRKLIWLLGLGWLFLGITLAGGRLPQGDLVSQWRAPVKVYFERSLFTALFVLVGAIALPAYLYRGEQIRWQVADLLELTAAALLIGAFLTWLELARARRAVTIDLREPALTVHSVRGLRRRSRILSGERLRHFELIRGGLGVWRVAAIERTGEPVPLLHYSSEVRARAALNRLGRDLVKPVVVRSEGQEYWTSPDEMPLNLRERAARRPVQEPYAKPEDTFLIQEQREGVWALGYPAPGKSSAKLLLSLAALVMAFAAMSTALLIFAPDSIIVRGLWLAAVVMLGLTAYAGMSLREELLAGLAGTHVEIIDGQLTYHDADNRTQSLPLEAIESVELGRQGDARTIAIVSPDHILHLRFFVPNTHLEWARREIEYAVAQAS